MAKANGDAQSDLQKRADQLREAGQAGEADKLEQQLQKLMEQAPQMEKLKDLANQLGQCSKCMKNGKGDKAGESMEQVLEQLEKLQKEQGELQSLNQAMEQLDDARNQMNCDKCKGKGCDLCQGKAAQDGAVNNRPGSGIGREKGGRLGPEKEMKDAKMFDSRVRQRAGMGPGTVTGVASGPNIKGKVEAEIQKESEAVEHGSTDPLAGRHIPRKHSEPPPENTSNRFREGQ